MSKWLLLGLIAVAGARGEDYCFGFLNAHPERDKISEARANEIQEGHMAHMRRMGQAGHLLAAGPIETPGGPRGILIYRCASLDQARQWTALDPAVQNKRLTLEVLRWRGPDGVGEPLASELKADPNHKVEMTKLPLLVLRPTGKWTGDASAEMMTSHIRHIGDMMQQGKLRAAGPFVDDQGRVGRVAGYLGLYVFGAIPLEQAKAMVGEDAFVREGYARIDAYSWWVANDAIPAR